MEFLRLTVRTADDGSWSVQLGTPSTRSVEGRVSASTVAALRIEAEALKAPVVVVRPDLDPWLTHLEESFGRALGAALQSDPHIAEAWARHAGRAEARDATRIVMLDADSEALGLPWELLADGRNRAPMEAEGTGCVVILGDGTARNPPAGPLSIEVLSDALEDPLVARLAARARIASGSDRRRLIHLVEHGTDRGYGLALGGDASRGMGTAVHGHQPSLRGAWLVALAICDAGARPELAVQRVLTAGAHAVLAPTERLATEVVEAVAEALADSAQSSTLVDAVLAARRAARSLALPFPDARWFRLRLTVASIDSLIPAPHDATPPVPPHLQRRATASSTDSLGMVLARARADAEANLTGFVGIEHLLMVLAESPGTSAQLRYAISTVDLRARFGGWRFMAERPVTNTPRVEALLSRCPPTTPIQDVETYLRERAPAILGWLLGASALQEATDGTWATLTGQGPLPAARALEILGGPEDGRVLDLQPGTLIGRWAESPRAAATLYRTTGLTDPRLSRAHLRWDGGAVTALAPVKRIRGSDQIRVPKGAHCELHVGDVLQCSAVTALRAVDTPTRS